MCTFPQGFPPTRHSLFPLIVVLATFAVHPSLAGIEAVPACVLDFASTEARAYVGGHGMVHPQSAYAITGESELLRLDGITLPVAMNLDALHVLGPQDFLFSVNRNGVLATSAGPMTLRHNNVYRVTPAAAPGTIATELDWQAEGLDIGSLNAIHKLSDDVYLFSTFRSHQPADGGSSFHIRPWEVWELDRAATPRLRRVLDAGPFGFDDVAALSLVSDADLRISPRTVRSLRVAGRLVRFWPNNAYRVNPNDPRVPLPAFDGAALGLPAIDAYSSGDGVTCDDGDPGTSWSVCRNEACVDFQPALIARGAPIARRALEQPLHVAPLAAVALRVTRAPAYDGDRLVTRANLLRGVPGSPYLVAQAVAQALEMAGTPDQESEYTGSRQIVGRALDAMIAYGEGEPLDPEIERALRLLLPRLLPLPPAYPGVREDVQELAARLLEIDEDDIRDYVARNRTLHVYRQLIGGVPIATSMILVISAEYEEDVLPPAAKILAAKAVVYRDVTIVNTPVLTEVQAVQSGELLLTQEIGVAVFGPHPDLPAPRLVLLPVADVFRYAFAIDLDTNEGHVAVWVDAEDGALLQFRGSQVAATETVTVAVPECGMPRDVDTDTHCDYESRSVPVDSPAPGSDYELTTGTIKGVVDLSDDEISSPDDDLTNECTAGDTDAEDAECTTSGSEHDPIECFVYDTVLNLFARFAIFGAKPVEALELRVNKDYCNASANVGSLTFGTCDAGRSDCPDFPNPTEQLNMGWDPTWITHEFGHRVSVTQAPTRAIRLGLQEGLNDYWGVTYTATLQEDAVQEFDGDDRLILARMGPHTNRARYTLFNMPPQQTGRGFRAADPADQFEDRIHGECHLDGHIIHWALASARDELVRRLPDAPVLGVMFDRALIDALQAHGITTGGNCCTCPKNETHEAFIEVLDEMMSVMAADTLLEHLINQVQAGFARANLFRTEKDAVVNITEDDLSPLGAPPSFEIWSGQPFWFDPFGSVQTAFPPFNTEYRLLLGSDADFSGNSVDTGWLAMNANAPDRDEPCPDQPDGNCVVYTLSAAEWDLLNDGERLYYKVLTQTPGEAGSLRLSEVINGLAIPAPFASISPGGVCGCGSTASAGHGSGSRLALALTFAVPLTLVLAVRNRWRRREEARQRRS